jgi:hypothetical protein
MLIYCSDAWLYAIAEINLYLPSKFNDFAFEFGYLAHIYNERRTKRICLRMAEKTGTARF